LLDRFAKHLAKGEARSDVHIGGGRETVFEVVHAFDVEIERGALGIDGEVGADFR